MSAQSHKGLKTRREFLRLAGIAAGATALAACATPTPQVIKETVVVEKPVEKVVKETVAVEVTKVVEKVVKETVPVEVTKVVEKVAVVTPTPYPLPPVKLPTAPVVTPAPPQPIQLFFWDWYGRLVWHNQDLKQVQVDIWNQANPNILVCYLPSVGTKEKVLASVAAGTPPDLLLTDPPTDYVYRGALESLQPFADQGGHPFFKKDIYPGVWEAMEFNGQLYAVHKVVNNAGLYYNADLFRQAGLDPDKPPKTLADVEEAAAKIHKTDSKGNIEILGFSPWLNIAGIWGTWAQAFGAKLWDPDNKKVTFDEPASIRALQWQVEYANKYGGFQKFMEFNDTLAGMDPFGSGRVGLYVTGPWQIGIMQDTYPNINYRTTTMPVPEGGRGGAWLGGSWLVMPKGGKRRKEAWEFLKYYCGREAQIYEAEQGIGFSIFPEDNAKSEWFNSLDLIQPFLQDLPKCWPIPLIPTVSHAFFTAFNPMVEEALRGKRTPEDAMKEATRLAQAEVDRFIKG